MNKPNVLIQVARLKHVAAMLSKYRNAYYRAMERDGGDLSPRMQGWMDEYETAAYERGPAWNLYCIHVGASKTHDVGDLMA